MPRQLRVFLCHASQDKPAVRKMYTYLKQHGMQPWLDREDLLPGQDWEVEIPRALYSSDVILVCLSKNSVNKEGYVQKEIAFALDKALEKPEGIIFIIPVKLEECDVPRRLSRYQWVDYYKVDGRKRLLMGLALRAQGLGEEIFPVVMDESIQGTPRVKLSKPEKGGEKENAVSDQPLPSEKQPEQKFNQKKPYTKLLDPSSLNPSLGREKKPQQNYRWYGFLGIVLLLFIVGGLGLNSLFSNLPEGTSTPTRQIFNETFEPRTETAIPFTPTLTETPAPSPTPTTVLGIGSTSKSLKDGVVLVYIPAGDFTMGSNEGGNDNKPAHQVYLDAFWIDQTEITNVMYKKCVDEGKCNFPSTQLKYLNNVEFDRYPVVFISWYDAADYCSWAGRRLPTEAEWEKAARSADQRTYPWGERISCKNANYSYCVGRQTDVGSYLDGISPYGVYDMAGNVWEWVNDWYDKDYYKNLSQSNPVGPDSGQNRVLRGGSWNYNRDYMRSYIRSFMNPSLSQTDVGFRCALSTP